MRKLERITLENFKTPQILNDLLYSFTPLIVQSNQEQTELFNLALELFKSTDQNLFNLRGNQTLDKEINSFQELLESIEKLKENAVKTSNISMLLKESSDLLSRSLISSKELNTERDFSVQMDIIPGSDISKILVEPILDMYSLVLKKLSKHVHLNTVLNISRGEGNRHNISRNIHGHNYDTFTYFPKAGPQTRVYFFPPSDYIRFQTRLIPSTQGILLLIPDKKTMHEGVLESAFAFVDIKPGDIVYTPPLWFHCFHHDAEYMNIAKGTFLPDLMDRLGDLRIDSFGQDGKKIIMSLKTLLSIYF